MLSQLPSAPDTRVTDDTDGHPCSKASQATSKSSCKVSVAVVEVVCLVLGLDNCRHHTSVAASRMTYEEVGAWGQSGGLLPVLIMTAIMSP